MFILKILGFYKKTFYICHDENNKKYLQFGGDG